MISPIIIRPASLPVVAGAALTIEDWSGTQVREAVTQTAHTEGTAHNYTATADHNNHTRACTCCTTCACMHACMYNNKLLLSHIVYCQCMSLSC